MSDVEERKVTLDKFHQLFKNQKEISPVSGYHQVKEKYKMNFQDFDRATELEQEFMLPNLS